jgi:glycosyltransferase involved in cell wall biosynthesis
MNIWFVNHYAVPTKYYPLPRPATFAKYLIRSGHSVTIFAASSVHNSDINLITDKSSFRKEVVDGIKYVYVRTSQYQGNGLGRIINMLQYPMRLPSVCRKMPKPDVILSTSVTPMACTLGIKLAKKYGCKAVAEIADLWPETFVAYNLIRKNNPIIKFMYWYEKRMYNMADRLIFTMEGGKDYIIEKGWDKASGGPIDLDKVHHINNGVDLEAFDYNKEHFQIDDADLKDNESFKVIYVGSIRLVNNLGLLLDTAKILKERGESKIKFLIWGDGNELEALKQRVQQEGLTNVSFKGRVDKKYVPYITSCGQLNIVLGKSSPLYKYGGSLNKMFDYFASGKPTLFTFRLGYSLIEKYEVGMELDTNDPIKIADAIMHFSEMPESQHQKYSINARAAAADFDFKILSSKLIKLLES